MCKERICGCMVLYAPFPLICYATGPCSEKKMNCDLLTPSPGSGVCGGGGGGGGVGVCGQNICYHIAAFVILFNLICNMTVF